MALMFVYGSLRKGYAHHDMISHTEFVAHDSITAIDVSCPPMYGIIEGMGAVKGEVYEVPDFVIDRVDNLEGVDFGMYIKKVVRTHRHRDVITYFASPRLAKTIALTASSRAMWEDEYQEELAHAA